jgi:hypothetical protein
LLGIDDLKNVLNVTNTRVDCPVKNCLRTVPRQRYKFRRLDEFKCPEHKIYISPSTFEYETRSDNILWKDEADQDLLFNRIAEVKREIKRIGRDNSEDAVTWNVFRFLEKENLLQDVLSKLTGCSAENPEAIYWSYSQSEETAWSELRQTRQEFEVNPERGSEPDLIVRAKNALFFIEAKLTATNNTIPTSNDPMVQEKYTKGGSGWYGNVFKSDFKTVAVADRKYELLRFWLLGSWIAHLLNLDFFLINLVLSRKEENIERVFGKHIKQSPNRVFVRETWEKIYNSIIDSEKEKTRKGKILEYFRNKTIGYDGNGLLQKAFSIK